MQSHFVKVAERAKQKFGPAILNMGFLKPYNSPAE